MVIVVSPDHRWSSRRSISADEFVEERILGGEPGTGTGRLLRSALGSLMDRMEIAQQLGSTEAVKRAVAAGLGISIVLASAVREEVAAQTLVALDLEGITIKRQLFVITPADAPPTAISRRFTTVLTQNP